MIVLINASEICVTSENASVGAHEMNTIYCALSFRLFWPKSRCFDYLYHEAEALLRNFPVQATICFYEDSESEEESEEVEHETG
uniref:Protein ripply2 n=1 Tax=Varanus komodoensis TaxID=61221 RepID=A0A8D2M143_VARKO